MKKNLFTLLGLVIITTAASAQFSAGAGLFYGFKTEKAALQGRGVYAFNDSWRAGADIAYYLDGSEYITIYEINLNAHYFFNQNNFAPYALAGLNIFSSGSDGYRESVTGFNLGFGGQYKIKESMSFLGEGKFVLGDADQFSLSAGLLFHF